MGPIAWPLEECTFDEGSPPPVDAARGGPVSAAVGLTLAVLTIAAFAAPLVAERTGVPGPVLELIVGLALGFALPSSTTGHGSFIGTLGTLGFLILMFLVGVEFDLSRIWRASKSAVAVGVGLFGVSIVASAVVLGQGLNASALWVVSGAATSVGITVPVLYTQGWLKNRFAQEAILIGTVAEFCYVVVLNAMSVAPSRGLDATILLATARTLVAVVAALVLGYAVRRARSATPHHFRRWYRRDDPIEVGLRGTFALLFLLVAASALVHIALAMGAVLAGIVFRNVIGEPRALIERLTSVANSFFIPLFFITVGVQTPLRLSLVALAPLVGAAILVQSVPRLLLVGYFSWRKIPLREGLAGSLLLMAPLTMLVTTAEIGERTGRLGPHNSAAMIVTAALSALVFPVAARRLLIASPIEGDVADTQS